MGKEDCGAPDWMDNLEFKNNPIRELGRKIMNLQWQLE